MNATLHELPGAGFTTQTPAVLNTSKAPDCLIEAAPGTPTEITAAGATPPTRLRPEDPELHSVFPPSLELPLWRTCVNGAISLIEELRAFNQFGKASICTTLGSVAELGYAAVPVFINEFWTAKQRQANSLHEVPYRASFKPQLPRFFIERLSQIGDSVLDPFSGRGTTAIEAALMRRVPIANDVNPLSLVFTVPRLTPPELPEVAERLEHIDLNYSGPVREDLLAFFHPDTLREIHALRDYFLAREAAESLDGVDEWIRLVATTRLKTHSAGYFSGWTLPPNQAITIESQLRLNAKHGLVPPRRDVRAIILRKSQQLLRDITPQVRRGLELVATNKKLLTGAADRMPQIADDSVQLVVTSPPFLNVVDYAQDNWLRCWFIGVDSESLALTVTPKLEAWSLSMRRILRELHRVLKPGGHIAFEVGEVQSGKVQLEETVLWCGASAGLEPVAVIINTQEFTKTSNCWNIENGTKGTNTNRIVVFRKNC